MDVMESGQLGKYRLRRLIERGAAGAFYESWDPDLARRVTVKVLPFEEFRGDREELYALFLGEAQAAERLHHPNIVSVFGSGKTRNSVYLVQDFVEGVTLSQALGPREALGLAEVAQIIESILNGLYYSHGRGVVHGDLTPERVLLAGNDQAKITGFGLAHLSHRGRAQHQQVADNSAYLAPEQLLGEAASRQSDIYAAGALLYAMLTGRPPFEGPAGAIVHQIVNALPLQPSRVVTTAPASLDASIYKALAKRPAERHASALEFASELRREFARLDLTRAAPVQRGPAEAEAGPSTGNGGVLPGGRPDRVAAEPLTRAAEVEPGQPRRRWQQPMLIAVGVLLLGGLWLALSGPGVQRDLGGPAEPNIAAAQGEREAMSGEQPAQKEPVPPDIATEAPPAAPPPAGSPEPKPEVSAAPSSNSSPVTSEAQLAALLRSTIATTPCSLIGANIAADGGVTVSGVTALGEASAIEAEANTRRALGAVPVRKGVRWEVSRIDGPYCAPLTALASAGGQDQDATRLAVASATAGWDAGSTAPLDLLVTMPDYPALLQVDVFSNDGFVLHRSMAVANGAGLYPASELVRLVAVVDRGRSADNAGAKPGLVAVIAASAPLFTERRPEREAAAAYLNDLTASLARARGRGDRVVPGALGLDAGS